MLPCGAGNSDWRQDALLRKWTRPPIGGGGPLRAVVATLQTASGDAFMDLCVAGRHLFMVADEVHRMGAVEGRRLLNIETGARLGLSATPRRAGDPEGTNAILSYFERVIEPPFTLADAIKARTLTPYAYYPIPIQLAADEQEKWLEVGTEAKRTAGRLKGEKTPDPRTLNRLKLLLIKRARIVKNARAKVDVAVRTLKENYADGQRWIVYCDGQGQLQTVATALRAAGLDNVYEYHSAMTGDRTGTLSLFTRRGGIVVAIRCLDEGVDIPIVSHALILASSRNPREFVQRRGRVLRTYPGKTMAYLYDAIVTPSVQDDESDSGSILAGELARAIEFGTNAINPGGVAELKRIAAEFSIDLSVANSGFEGDDDGSDAETTDV